MLKKFQFMAVAKMQENFLNHKSTILSSPTGSGKTIMLATFVNDILVNYPNEDYTFLWISPGKGKMHEQSYKKFKKYFPNMDVQLLDEMQSDRKMEKGKVTFLNWEAINKKDNLLIRKSEIANLDDIILNTKSKIVLIIDEQHMNNTEKTHLILKKIKPFFTIMASATIVENSFEKIEIKRKDVVESGLIKKEFVINQGVGDNIEEYSLVEELLHLANEKRKLLKDLFSNQKNKVNPLVIVQIPNKEEEKMEEVLDILRNKGMTTENGLVAIYLDKIKVNIHDVELNNAKPNFIISKQAISTGWDAPRAYILVKLRFTKNERFSIQTLGRINRMPHGIHYQDERLNSSYVYTNDEKFTNKILGNVANSFITEISSQRTTDYNQLKIPMIKSNNEANTINMTLFKKRFTDYLKNKIGTKKDDFQSQGFIFSNKVIQSIARGFVNNEDLNVEDNIYFSKTKSIMSNNFVYLYGKTSIAKLAQKIPTNYMIMKRVFDSIFDGRRGGQIIKFTNRINFMKFFINNFKEIQKHIEIFLRNETFQSTFNFVDDRREYYMFPKTLTVKSKKKDDFKNLNKLTKKSLYSLQLISDPTFSKSERMSVEFFEASKNIKHWLKNGDSGFINFSVKYKNTEISNERNFFPDFIIILENGDIWFIESKGEEHFDDAIIRKFHALKEYVTILNKSQEGKYNFAFAKIFDKKLLFNNINYSEELTDDWISGEELFK